MAISHSIPFVAIAHVGLRNDVIIAWGSLLKQLCHKHQMITWASLPCSFLPHFILVYYMGFLQTYSQANFPHPNVTNS